MPRKRLVAAVLAALAAALLCAVVAGATGSDWAAPQIRIVTRAGVLGNAPATFAPQSALTQSALAAAIKATDALQHAPVTPTTPPPALTVVSNVGVNSTVGGALSWTVDSPGRQIDHVDFAVDGVGIQTVRLAPFAHPLDTRLLADGSHQLAVNVTLARWLRDRDVDDHGRERTRIAALPTFTAGRRADREVVAAPNPSRAVSTDPCALPRRRARPRRHDQAT